MKRPAANSMQGRTVVRFLGAMAAGNLVWEVGHVPFYSLWVDGTRSEIAYAVLHCTVGDVIIAAVCLFLSLTLVGRGTWPVKRFGAVAAATILLGLSYTVFSEWLNTEVWANWTYRDAMPRLPVLGTGLTPVLQWIVVPAVAFRWAVAGES